MPASLVAISDAPRVPKAREQQLKERFRESRGALLQALRSLKDPSLESLFDDYDRAHNRQITHWETRLSQAERCLYALLPRDLSAEERELVLTTLRVNRRRNPHLLSNHELQVIEQYRATDNSGRHLIRLLFARISVTNETPQGGAQ